MQDKKITEEDIKVLYKKILEGKTLEIISRELNITLDILKDWKNENYDEIEMEIKKIREAGKKKRLNSQNDLDQLEDELGRIDIHKIKE